MFIGFVTEGKNSPPKPEVWTNIITGGGEVDFVQNFIPMSEVWTNIVAEGGGLSPQKNSRIDYPTLYFFGEKI